VKNARTEEEFNLVGSGGTVGKRPHLGDLGINVRIILKTIRK
jgi:hypothetical protein